MNIVLIGYRGSGKTTVGRGLAARLGRTFVDLDAVIVHKAGKSIRDIFAHGGEGMFRDIEATVVAEYARRDGLVIAAGGGVVLRAENVANLKQHGKLIWLKADARTLYERIARDQTTETSRPDLTALGGLEEVETLLGQRLALYEQAADVTVESGGVMTGDVVEKLVELAAKEWGLALQVKIDFGR